MRHGKVRGFRSFVKKISVQTDRIGDINCPHGFDRDYFSRSRGGAGDGALRRATPGLGVSPRRGAAGADARRIEALPGGRPRAALAPESCGGGRTPDRRPGRYGRGRAARLPGFGARGAGRDPFGRGDLGSAFAARGGRRPPAARGQAGGSRHSRVRAFFCAPVLVRGRAPLGSGPALDRGGAPRFEPLVLDAGRRAVRRRGEAIGAGDRLRDARRANTTRSVFAWPR